MEISLWHIARSPTEATAGCGLLGITLLTVLELNRQRNHYLRNTFLSVPRELITAGAFQCFTKHYQLRRETLTREQDVVQSSRASQDTVQQALPL